MLIASVDISKLYESGMPISEIVTRCGARYSREVYFELEKLGVKPSRAKAVEKYVDIEEDPLTPVIRALRREMTIGEVCERVGKSVNYVKRRLFKQEKIVRPALEKRPIEHIATPPRKLTDWEKAEIVRMRKKRKRSVKMIAKHVRRAPSTVRDFLDKVPGVKVINHRPKNPWPKVTTNWKRALKGRRFEDVPLRLGSFSAAVRNGMKIYEQPGARL